MFFKHLNEEIESIIRRDPAARSKIMVALAYPGFHAVLLHSAAQALWRLGLRTLGRIVSQFARWLTGIEIHPAARIGRRLFIDHGMGVVIGETAVIGDDVTLYQGVTLGGISPSINAAAQVNVKRHPTLENGVIVGSGAQVLGDIVLGAGSRVGANAVVVENVPPGVVVVGVPAKVVMPKDSCCDFTAYGIPAAGIPDPVAHALDVLGGQIESLQARINALEAERDGAAPVNGDDGVRLQVGAGL